MQLQIGFDLSNLSWLPLVEPSIRIEEQHEADRYIMRAEVPGVDPEKDIDIAVKSGELRVVVVRLNDGQRHDHTEFHYGTFHRTVTLPPGTRKDTITAEYVNGILEITMSIAQPTGADTHISVHSHA